MLPSNSRFRGWWWLVPNWSQGRYTLLPAAELNSGRQMEVQNEQESNAKKKTI
jgi:hypothetical protein